MLSPDDDHRRFLDRFNRNPQELYASLVIIPTRTHRHNRTCGLIIRHFLRVVTFAKLVAYRCFIRGLKPRYFLVPFWYYIAYYFSSRIIINYYQL